MKTVGDTLDPFWVMSAKPAFTEAEQNGESAFQIITEESFPGKWKVFYFYPKDFTGVCDSEVQMFHNLHAEFQKLDTVLLGGSCDGEYCKLALRRENKSLQPFSHYSFGDPAGQLIDQLGIRDKKALVSMRATVIVNPDNVIMHLSVLPLFCSRSVKEILRLLEILKAGQPIICNL